MRVRYLWLAFSFASCSRTTPAPPPPPAEVTPKSAEVTPKSAEVTPKSAEVTPNPDTKPTAREMIAAGAVVIDVRTPEEFGAGHLPSATNLPIEEFDPRLTD